MASTISTQRTSIIARLRKALRVSTLVRAVAVSAVSILSAIVLVIVLLVTVGTVVSPDSIDNAIVALSWVSAVNLILTGMSLVLLLFGVVAVATVVVRPRISAALLSALRVLPRLLVALIGVTLAIVVAVIASPAIVVAALVTALVFRLRHRSGVRRALVCAIPLLPVVMCLAAMPALVAASCEQPRTFAALLRAASAIVRTRWRALLVYIAVTAGASVALTLPSAGATDELQALGQADLALVISAVALGALLVVQGITLAVVLPPMGAVTAARSPRTRLWRLGGPLFTRVAMLVVATLVVSVVPATVSASSASASSVIAPVLSASIAPSADSDVPDALAGGAGGAVGAAGEVDPADPSDGLRWTLRADVTVPEGDPAGVVQFLDGELEVGEPVTLAPADNSLQADGAEWVAAFAELPNTILAAGEHSISFVYAPTSSSVSAGTAEAIAHQVSPGVSGATEHADLGPESTSASDAVDAPTTDASGNPDPTSTAAPTGDTDTNTNTDSPAVGSAGDGIPATDPETAPSQTDPSEAVPSEAVPSEAVPFEAVPSEAVPFEAIPSPTDVFAPDASPSAPSPAAAPATADVAPYAFDPDAERIDPLSLPVVTPVAVRVPVRFLAVAQANALAPLTASTSATATLSTRTISFRESVDLTVIVDSSEDGPRTLEVRDTSTNALLSTRTIQILGGTATEIVALTDLGPGQHVITATVLGDALHDEVIVTVPALLVNSAVTTTDLVSNLSSVEFGTEITFYSTTLMASGDTTRSGGRVTFYVDGVNIGSGVPDSSGRASTKWTPTTNDVRQGSFRDVPVSASYFDTTFAYAASTGKSTVRVSRVPLPAPTMVWTGDSSNWMDRYLTLTYPAAEGRPVPGGLVRLLDPNEIPIATLPLVDGVVTFRVLFETGIPPLTAEFMSTSQGPDRTYQGRFDAVPDAQPAAYIPVVTIDAPTDVVNGVPFAVSVTVEDVPLVLVENVLITDTKPDGSVHTVGFMALDSFGVGQTDAILTLDGAHKLGAVVSFTYGSGADTTWAPSIPVTVAAPVPSVPHLVITSTGDPVVGGSIEVDVTAQWIAPGSTGLPAGTIAEVRNGSGTLVGTVTLWGAAGVGGYTGKLTLTNLLAGPLTLTATAPYGPLGTLAQSAPLSLTVPPPATVLVVTAPSVVVGQTLNVTVTAHPLGGFSGVSRSESAVIVVDGVRMNAELTRTTATGPFSVSFGWPTAQAGTLAVSASIDGDGIDTSAATAATTADILKRATSIALVLDHASATAARAGEPVTVTPKITQVGYQSSPAPTGALTIGGVSCTNGVPCVIPGSAVRSGVNTLYAHLDGDANNLASTASISFTAAARTSALTVSYSPAVEDWVYGEPITATWSTLTSASPAIGQVAVTIAGASCTGPALAGSCTVTPTTTATVGPITTTYSVNFVPGDDAPPAQVSGQTQRPSICVYPTIMGTVDYGSATRCGFEQRGVRTGTSVLVTPDLTDGAAFDAWTLDGVVLTTTSVPLALTINSAIVLSYSSKYAPACYTLNLTPTRSQLQNTGGVLSALTSPNCANPLEPTAEEMEQWNAGAPRYAAGTVVYVRADASDATATRPKFVLAGVINGSAMVNDTVGTVTMDADHAVSATFAVNDCVITEFPEFDGGSMELISASRPASSSALKPETGACTSVSGRAGYVPGTTLTVTATAEADTVIDSWVIDQSSFRDLTEEQRDARAVGALPEATVATTRTVVVPETYRLQLGARFSRVECVSVTLIDRTLVHGNGSYYPESVTTLGTADTAPGCGGIPEERTSVLTGSKVYRVTKVTNSYVAAGRAFATTTQPLTNSRQLDYRTRIGYGRVVWSTSSTVGVVARALDGHKSGPSIDLGRAEPAITITANWMMVECAAPNVALPQGGGFTITPAFEDEPFCADPTQVAPGQSVTIHPIALPGAPGLVPFISPVTTAGGTTTYERNSTTIIGARSYQLEYCAPLGIQVRLHDEGGVMIVVGEEQAASLMSDDGGCPPLWTRPGRTVKTEISADAKLEYVAKNNAQGLGPVRVADAAGVLTGPAVFDIQLACFSPLMDEAHITTAANCPGGAGNRFVRGTTVEMQAQEADRFYGWSGADADAGQTAWVVMDRDRSVAADTRNLSDWEKAQNVASSIAARTVSAALSFATGLMLANAVLLQSASTALNKAAGGLRAVGLGGAVADGLAKSAQVIDAQVKAIKLLADCVSGWAHGDNILDNLPTVAPGGSTALPQNPTDEQKIQAAKNLLQNEVAKRSGTVQEKAQKALSANGVIIVNSFLSNLDMYNTSASSQWGSLLENVGDCVATGLKKYGEDTYTGW